MLTAAVAILLAGAKLSSAHFAIIYPEWRADTLSVEEGSTYDQWVYPCANVPADAGNRTEWPVRGGAVSLHLHHPWSYVYINLGLGDNVTNFNITLTPQLMNVTGEGDFCIPELPVPEGAVREGQNATIQVVTNGNSGSALYNCADIVFRANMTSSNVEQCTNSTGVSAEIVGLSSSGSGPESEEEGEPDTPGSAAAVAASTVTLTAFVGLAMVFATGLGFS
ncbi:hypothetical protein DL764_009985 [Monosporascus ibericus]|uniref:Copper acquisition factor BIM1-like domain-containing protein n=1 Tax=Monosporascus ibericus TaxID=155417 RepID=A0A4Q4STK6_9PEZI|nr:hypothetical protein DL764_009985 [Monosporascus ibericus]